MKALWDAGRPLTRPELDGALCGHRWAATTVLGLLSRLEGKGFLTRRRQGRGYLYAPAVPREAYLAVEGRSALGLSLIHICVGAGRALSLRGRLFPPPPPPCALRPAFQFAFQGLPRRSILIETRSAAHRSGISRGR